MKPLEAVITGPSTRDGYFFAALSVSSTVVEGVSIYRVNLPAGIKVTVIQCGQLDRGAQFGFAQVSRGLVGVAQIPPQGLPQIYDEAPYSSAAAWIGATAGQLRMIYSRAMITAIAASRIDVSLADGQWAGKTMSCQVAANVGLSSGMFEVGESILIRWHPERQPVVVGWWEPAGVGICQAVVFPPAFFSYFRIGLERVDGPGAGTTISNTMNAELFPPPTTPMLEIDSAANTFSDAAPAMFRSSRLVKGPTTIYVSTRHQSIINWTRDEDGYSVAETAAAVPLTDPANVIVRFPMGLLGAYIPFVSFPSLGMIRAGNALRIGTV